MGTITKALELLSHFSADRAEIGLAEFARLTSRDKATVHRHLNELCQNGFLEQAEDTGPYRLGPALSRLGHLRERTFPPREAIMPIVRNLATVTGELTHVALFRDGTLTPICHADMGVFGVRVTFDETEILPLHATASGLAVLAFGPPEVFHRLQGHQMARYTDQTETDAQRLIALVETTRAQGYSVSDGYFEEDILALAAPVFDHEGLAMGAIAIAYPRARAENRPAAPLLIQAAADITRTLGGALPDNIERLWRTAA